MKEKKLNILHFRIIATVHFLKENNYYSNAKGIYNILKGNGENEHKNIKTYSSMLSVNSRRVHSHIKSLIKEKYLFYFYDSDNDQLYIDINNNILLLLKKFEQQNKNIYKINNKNTIKNIIQKKK